MYSMVDPVEVKLVLKSCLVANPNTMTVRQLYNQFRTSEGYNVPFRELGFNDFNQYLLSISDTLMVIGSGPNAEVRVIVSEKSAHIVEMVAKQRSNSKKPSRRGFGRMPYNYRISLPPRISKAKPIYLGGFTHPQPAHRSRPLIDHNDPSYRPDFSDESDSCADEKENVQKKSVEPLLKSGQSQLIPTQVYTKVRNERPPAQIPSLMSLNLSNVTNHNLRPNQHSTPINNDLLASRRKTLLSSSQRGVAEPPATPTHNKYASCSSSGSSHSSLKKIMAAVKADESRAKSRQSVPEEDVFLSDEEKNVNYKIPHVMQNNFKELLNANKDGIWCGQMPKMYKERFGVDLTYQKFGYRSLIQLCADLPYIFQYRQADKGDFKLYDAKQNVPKDRFGLLKESAQLRNMQKDQKPDRPALPTDIIDILANDPNAIYPDDVMKPDEAIPRQVIDTLEDDYIDLIIAEIYDPSKFWFNVIPASNELDNLMDEMQVFYKDRLTEYEIPASKMVENLYCAAYFYGEYQRAKIVNTLPQNPTHTKVFFIDYGTVATILTSHVRYLHRSFMEMPTQAIRGRLARIHPLRKDQQWCRDSSHRFLALVKEKNLVGQIDRVDYEKDIYDLLVADTTGSKDIFINDTLVFEGYGKFHHQRQDPPEDSDCVPLVEEIHLYPTFEEFESGVVPNSYEIAVLAGTIIELHTIYPQYYRKKQAPEEEEEVEEEESVCDEVQVKYQGRWTKGNDDDSFVPVSAEESFNDFNDDYDEDAFEDEGRRGEGDDERCEVDMDVSDDKGGSAAEVMNNEQSKPTIKPPPGFESVKPNAQISQSYNQYYSYSFNPNAIEFVPQTYNQSYYQQQQNQYYQQQPLQQQQQQPNYWQSFVNNGLVPDPNYYNSLTNRAMDYARSGSNLQQNVNLTAWTNQYYNNATQSLINAAVMSMSMSGAQNNAGYNNPPMTGQQFINQVYQHQAQQATNTTAANSTSYNQPNPIVGNSVKYNIKENLMNAEGDKSKVWKAVENIWKADESDSSKKEENTTSAKSNKATGATKKKTNLPTNVTSDKIAATTTTTPFKFGKESRNVFKTDTGDKSDTWWSDTELSKPSGAKAQLKTKKPIEIKLCGPISERLRCDASQTEDSSYNRLHNQFDDSGNAIDNASVKLDNTSVKQVNVSVKQVNVSVKQVNVSVKQDNVFVKQDNVSVKQDNVSVKQVNATAKQVNASVKPPGATAKLVKALNASVAQVNASARTLNASAKQDNGSAKRVNATAKQDNASANQANVAAERTGAPSKLNVDKIENVSKWIDESEMWSKDSIKQFEDSYKWITDKDREGAKGSAGPVTDFTKLLLKEKDDTVHNPLNDLLLSKDEVHMIKDNLSKLERSACSNTHGYKRNYTTDTPKPARTFSSEWEHVDLSESEFDQQCTSCDVRAVIDRLSSAGEVEDNQELINRLNDKIVRASKKGRKKTKPPEKKPELKWVIDDVSGHAVGHYTSTEDESDSCPKNVPFCVECLGNKGKACQGPKSHRKIKSVNCQMTSKQVKADKDPAVLNLQSLLEEKKKLILKEEMSKFYNEIENCEVPSAQNGNEIPEAAEAPITDLDPLADLSEISEGSFISMDEDKDVTYNEAASMDQDTFNVSDIVFDPVTELSKSPSCKAVSEDQALAVVDQDTTWDDTINVSDIVFDPATELSKSPNCKVVSEAVDQATTLNDVAEFTDETPERSLKICQSADEDINLTDQVSGAVDQAITLNDTAELTDETPEHGLEILQSADEDTNLTDQVSGGGDQVNTLNNVAETTDETPVCALKILQSADENASLTDQVSEAADQATTLNNVAKFTDETPEHGLEILQSADEDTNLMDQVSCGGDQANTLNDIAEFTDKTPVCALKILQSADENLCLAVDQATTLNNVAEFTDETPERDLSFLLSADENVNLAVQVSGTVDQATILNNITETPDETLVCALKLLQLADENTNLTDQVFEAMDQANTLNDVTESPDKMLEGGLKFLQSADENASLAADQATALNDINETTDETPEGALKLLQSTDENTNLTDQVSQGVDQANTLNIITETTDETPLCALKILQSADENASLTDQLSEAVDQATTLNEIAGFTDETPDGGFKLLQSAGENVNLAVQVSGAVDQATILNDVTESPDETPVGALNILQSADENTNLTDQVSEAMDQANTLNDVTESPDKTLEGGLKFLQSADENVSLAADQATALNDINETTDETPLYGLKLLQSADENTNLTDQVSEAADQATTLNDITETTDKTPVCALNILKSADENTNLTDQVSEATDQAMAPNNATEFTDEIPICTLKFLQSADENASSTEDQATTDVAESTDETSDSQEFLETAEGNDFLLQLSKVVDQVVVLNDITGGIVETLEEEVENVELGDENVIFEDRAMALLDFDEALDLSMTAESKLGTTARICEEGLGGSTTKIKPSSSLEINLSTTTDVKPSSAVEINLSTTTDVKPSSAAENNLSTITDIKPSSAAKINLSTTTDVKPSSAAKINLSTTTDVTPITTTEAEPSMAAEIKLNTVTDIILSRTTDFNLSTTTNVNPSMTTNLNPSTTTDINRCTTTDINLSTTAETHKSELGSAITEACENKFCTTTQFAEISELIDQNDICEDEAWTSPDVQEALDLSMTAKSKLGTTIKTFDEDLSNTTSVVRRLELNEIMETYKNELSDGTTIDMLQPGTTTEIKYSTAAETCDKDLNVTTVKIKEEKLQPGTTAQIKFSTNAETCDKDLNITTVEIKEDMLQPGTTAENKLITTTRTCDKDLNVTTVELKEMLQPGTTAGIKLSTTTQANEQGLDGTTTEELGTIFKVACKNEIDSTTAEASVKDVSSTTAELFKTTELTDENVIFRALPELRDAQECRTTADILKEELIMTTKSLEKMCLNTIAPECNFLNTTADILKELNMTTKPLVAMNLDSIVVAESQKITESDLRTTAEITLNTTADILNVELSTTAKLLEKINYNTIVTEEATASTTAEIILNGSEEIYKKEVSTTTESLKNMNLDTTIAADCQKTTTETNFSNTTAYILNDELSTTTESLENMNLNTTTIAESPESQKTTTESDFSNTTANILNEEQSTTTKSLKKMNQTTIVRVERQEATINTTAEITLLNTTADILNEELSTTMKSLEKMNLDTIITAESQKTAENTAAEITLLNTTADILNEKMNSITESLEKMSLGTIVTDKGLKTITENTTAENKLSNVAESNLRNSTASIKVNKTTAKNDLLNTSVESHAITTTEHHANTTAESDLLNTTGESNVNTTAESDLLNTTDESNVNMTSEINIINKNTTAQINSINERTITEADPMDDNKNQCDYPDKKSRYIPAGLEMLSDYEYDDLEDIDSVYWDDDTWNRTVTAATVTLTDANVDSRTDITSVAADVSPSSPTESSSAVGGDNDSDSLKVIGPRRGPRALKDCDSVVGVLIEDVQVLHGGTLAVPGSDDDLSSVDSGMACRKRVTRGVIGDQYIFVLLFRGRPHAIVDEVQRLFFPAVLSILELKRVLRLHGGVTLDAVDLRKHTELRNELVRAGIVDDTKGRLDVVPLEHLPDFVRCFAKHVPTFNNHQLIVCRYSAKSDVWCH